MPARIKSYTDDQARVLALLVVTYPKIPKGFVEHKGTAETKSLRRTLGIKLLMCRVDIGGAWRVSTCISRSDKRLINAGGGCERTGIKKLVRIQRKYKGLHGDMETRARQIARQEGLTLYTAGKLARGEF